MQLYKAEFSSDMIKFEYINETVKPSLVTVSVHLVTVVNLGAYVENTVKVIG